MEKVTIIRKWNSPVVHINVNLDGMSVSMPLAEFLSALAHEMSQPLATHLSEVMGNPTLWVSKQKVAAEVAKHMTPAMLATELVNASESVTSAMKAETSKLS